MKRAPANHCFLRQMCLALLLLATMPGLPFALAAPPVGTAPCGEIKKFIEIPLPSGFEKTLQEGGYVLYLRHAPTDNTKPDRFPAVDLNDCSTQRPLSPEGRLVAARVGETLRRARVPIGEIHMSPLCRVKDTVTVAFPGRVATTDKDLMYTGNMTCGQKAPIIANTRRLLSLPVAPGTNRVVVAHGPNLMDLMGYFPTEATLAIFRPQGFIGGISSYEYIGSLLPSGGIGPAP